MKDNLREWLQSGQPRFIDKINKDTTHYFRIPRDDVFDYLFRQSNYNKEKLQPDKLEYTGIFNKLDNQVYDAQIDALTSDPSNTYRKLRDVFEKEVKDRINRIINNDRSILAVTDVSEITNIALKRNIEYAQEYRNSDYVRKLFLGGCTPEDIVYESDYIAEKFTSEDYLDYIIDKESVIDGFAVKWIENNQEDIFAEFISNDITKEELQKTIDNPDNMLHTIKEIMDIMKDTDCKTVNVTTIIDGKEMTFKAEADTLRRDCKYNYSSWNLPASDRRAFEEFYGRNTNYTPNNIVCIKHGKNILYSNPMVRINQAAQDEPPEESQGMSMNM